MKFSPFFPGFFHLMAPPGRSPLPPPPQSAPAFDAKALNDLGFYPFQKWRIKYPLAWKNNVENLAEIDFKKM